ncbi:MAG: hypothetical protein H0X38_12385 [Planctomycetes bacterium]|nr:hypothetical protein [Planctomycetota bacterium]
MTRHAWLKDTLTWTALALALPLAVRGSAPAAEPTVAGLPGSAAFAHWVGEFNGADDEIYPHDIPDAASGEFLAANVPLFSCPDREFERTMWFRWWTLRKHLRRTPDGWVMTEFLPDVPWAGKHNTISCAVMHHIREARWLADPRFLDDYGDFWLGKGGAVRSYSCPIADALWQRRLVTGDQTQVLALLPALIANYEAWERDHRAANGLYWQIDDRDGMEVSLGGSGLRATINSYQFADATAIAAIAEQAGKVEVASAFQARAATLRRLVLAELWNPADAFFEVRPLVDGQMRPSVGVRELHGYTPWYVGLAGQEQAVAWGQLMDPQGFFAPCGPTTAERRAKGFALNYSGHECQWNGPSWPFATAVTLTALANLLNGPPQQAIAKQDYFTLLGLYAASQRRTREDGVVVPWIDEVLNPLTGDWISRTRLKTWKNGTWDAGAGGRERGKDYNHSAFCDLVITGLVGLRPRADATVEVNPLLPEGTWPWFSLDRVPYHGHLLAIVYDRDGDHFHLGRGLRVYADGHELAAAPGLSRLTAALP